jgi:hypothetical protein
MKKSSTLKNALAYYNVGVVIVNCKRKVQRQRCKKLQSEEQPSDTTKSVSDSPCVAKKQRSLPWKSIIQNM